MKPYGAIKIMGGGCNTRTCPCCDNGQKTIPRGKQKQQEIDEQLSEMANNDTAQRQKDGDRL